MNVTSIRPRLRLIDCVKAAEREGKQLRYQPRQGVVERKCSFCHQVIKYGMCDCTPTAA